MYITKLVLVGYKRLLLNNIQRFEYTPTSIFQMIIGTNGSGKSSVLRELSPLPAVPADYQKGGSKTIELEHRGQNYRLVSDFTQGSKHAFIHLESGEDYNPGGTASVQKELVRTHFGLTSELFELLTGNTTFTQMPANKRREWIVNLSESDLDYAIGIYNRLKSAHRDTQGAIKHLNGRITAETDKLMDTDQLVSLQRQVDRLVSELNTMMEERSPSVDSHTVIESSINATLRKMTEVSKLCLGLDLSKPSSSLYGNLESLHDIQSTHGSIKSLHAAEEAKHNAYSEEYSHLVEILAVLSQSGATGIEELKETIATLESEIAAIRQQVSRFYLETQTDLVYSQTQEVGPLLQTTLSDIPNNDGRFGQTQRNEIVARLDKAKAKHDQLLGYSEKLSKRYQHLKNAAESQCPKCDYVWKPGIDDRELVALEAKSNEVQIHITQLMQTLQTDEQYLVDYENYRYAITRFKRLTESYPLLRELWLAIGESGWLYTTPQQCWGLYQTWLSDVSISLECWHRQKRLTEYQQAIAHAESVNKTESSHLGSRQEHLEAAIESSNQALTHYRLTLSELANYGKRVSEFDRYSGELEDLYRKLQGLLDSYTDAYRNHHLDRTIKSHQITLSGLNHQIMSARLAADVVANITRDKDELVETLKAYQIVLDELSPVDGLIAEQINDFMVGLVSQMNHVIGQIWTYDMEIRPCGLDSGELDYKFPLIVKNHDLVVPDVSRGSSSQVDVVDFAFKLIVMVYLNLQDYPLYLDELAPTLDEQHRLRIIRYVREVVEGHQCAQMFMISHYNEAFAAFGSAEVVVMDSTNILTIPGTYNTNVKFN